MSNADIDFVITWVDGRDPVWMAELARARKEYGCKHVHSTSEIRFRDWGLLKYWFRALEVNCPWVKKVHFITYGHMPEWINIDHPKLNIVKHSDIIPAECLPTFNSRAIELSMGKIKGLSEKFVYFNDDVFLLNPVGPDYFFSNGLPNDSFSMLPASQTGLRSHIGLVQFSCMSLINEKVNKHSVVSNNFFKIFSCKYPVDQNLGNLLQMPYKNFSAFQNFHLSQPYLKKTFEDVWSFFSDELYRTSLSKFRDHSNLNVYLMRYWALVSGSFSPVNKFKYGYSTTLSDKNLLKICEDIVGGGDVKEICLNDGEDISDFAYAKSLVANAFGRKFPNISSFEKS